MKSTSIIKKLEILENNARRLYEDAVSLKEELSGGSGSSISKPAVSSSQKDAVLNRFRKNAMKQ